MMNRFVTRWAAVAAVAGWIGLGGSCVSHDYDVTRVNTYIGPARPAATATQPAAKAPVPGLEAAGGAIQIDAYKAIVMALANNRSLAVEKYRPPIARTFEQTELSAFDPVLSGQASGGHTTALQGRIGGADVKSTSGNVQAALTEFLPTGTRLGVTAASTVGRDRFVGGEDSARIGLTATQALMRGYGLDVNLASLRQARLDTLSSEYELRGFAQAVAGAAEQAYWDFVVAGRQVTIVERSWQLARDQLGQANERIQVGRLAETERAAAEAEVALREQARIDARSAEAKARVTLLRLLNPPGTNALDRVLDVKLEAQAIRKAADTKVDPLEEHLALAQRMRPEINQAKLLIERDELEIVKTRNGLLPKLDLFVTLGKSGYSGSVGEMAAGVFTSENFDAVAGVIAEMPLGNRGPRAAHERAVLGKDLARQALENLSQLVESDVRLAYIELVRSKEQVAAAAATTRLQAEKVRAEEGKFSEQRSTSLQVALAQRDLLAAELAEVQAWANYLKAFVDLYRLEGSLLERRGIAAPGGRPVEASRPGWAGEMKRP